MSRPFDPAHPFGIYLSMMDGAVDDLTGPAAATRFLAARIAWTLADAGYSYALTNGEGRAAIRLQRPLDLTITLAIAPRHAERHQWRIAFESAPPLAKLDENARWQLRNLHQVVTDLVIAAEEVEDVDVTRGF
ncbi:MAG: hypothetical protein ACOYM8_15555 [Caulobacterales bacterium]